uniref:Uncharacterized protein n=1 Tax=Junco hyemalis TaxID=40217 RepID=A0A8C5JKW7_JUNHY
MAAVAAAGAGAAGAAGAVAAPHRGIRTWLRSAFRFATDRNDFRRWLFRNSGWLLRNSEWLLRNLNS